MRNKQEFQIIDGCLCAGGRRFFIKNIKIQSILSNEGANATVYLAYDSYLNRKVALKIWCRKDRKIEISTERAKEECAKIAKLRHPRISLIYFADIIEGYPVAVLELLEGVTLQEWLKMRHKFSDRRSIWDQISEALEYCHRGKIFHGDLHWKNIMVNNEKVTVFDFGSSLFSAYTNSLKRENRCLLELAGKIFGDIPFDELICRADNPEFTRQAIDSVLSISFRINHLKEKLTKKMTFSDEESYHFIFGIVCDMADSPIIRFDAIERILKELTFSDRKYENFVLQIFYNYLSAASTQRLEDKDMVDVPENIGRELAEKKYIKWRVYYKRCPTTTVAAT